MSAIRRNSRLATIAVLSLLISLGCGGDSGPSDTTNSVMLDAVTTPTNLATQVISGTTDPNSNVTVTAPADTTIGVANTSGTFGLSITLSSNISNSIQVSSVDPAGNSATASTSIVHDDVAPTLSMSAPSSVTPTAGQSGFDITANYSDSGSGIDQASVVISNDRDIGGAFKQDGTFSTVISSSGDLVPLFSSVTTAQATYTVADSLLFPAGANNLAASVSDLAGNTSPLARGFQVSADTTRLIVVNSSGSPGATAVPLRIGMANGSSVSGVQFDLTYDTLVVAAVAGALPAGRASSFSAAPFNLIAPGRVRVLLFDLGGSSIGQGQGDILLLTLDLQATAPTGAQTLTLESVVISLPGGGTVPAVNATGTLTVQ